MGTLRFILSLVVIISHTSSEILIGSVNAVRLFFIISGFLISYVINNNPAYLNKSTFWISRAIRIYPVYWFVLFLSLFFPAYGAETYKIFTNGSILLSSFLSFTNVFIVGQEFLLFKGFNSLLLINSPEIKSFDIPMYRGLFIPQAWSLSLELIFYILAPFIIRNKIFTLLILLSGFILRYIFYANGYDQDPWNYRFFPFEISLFLLGAFMQQNFNIELINKNCITKIISNIIIIIFIMFFIYYDHINMKENYKGLLLAIFCALSIPKIFYFERFFKLDGVLGELSYPMYISHVLIISLTTFMISYMSWISKINRTFLIILLTIIFSKAIVLFVVEPIEKYRKNAEFYRKIKMLF